MINKWWWLTAVFLAGCAGGPAQDSVLRPTRAQIDANQVGILRIAKAKKLGRVRIESVDGEPIKGWDDRLDLPAGRHEVQISFVYGDGVSSFRSETNCPFRFTVEPGKVYLVKSKVDFKQRTWTATLTDVLTGAQLDECRTAPAAN